VNSIIAAAPTILTSSAPRIEFLASAGIDIITYKTVRSCPYRAHQKPNVFAVEREVNLNPDNIDTPRVVVMDVADSKRMIALVNRFGVPSLPPEEWQADFAAARARLRPGQILVLSVMGTAKKDDPEVVLVADFVQVVQLALEAGAEAIELNLSCPNCAGREGELYKDLRLSKIICRSVREAAPHVRLLLKLGYMSLRETEEFVLETAEYVDGYVAINSVAVEPWVDGQFGEVLALAPGVKAGLSGKPIKRHALRMVRQLAELRVRERLDRIWIAGCGGVTQPEDVVQFVQNGADIVEVGTKLLEDPLFGVRARQHLELNPPMTMRKAADPVDVAHLNWLHAIDSIEGLKHDERGMIEAVHVFFRWRAGRVGSPDRAFRTDYGKSTHGVPTIAEFRRLLLEALPKRGGR
jgi:dihydroorotate dehydrogenase